MVGDSAAETSPIGRRVIVLGPSCAGKSTLGARLASLLGLPFVELDALFWKPDWVETPDDEFQDKLRAATSGDAWVVAGGYHRQTQPVLWPSVQTIVWLDLPLLVSTWRIIKRSWRRSRNHELLWGTNYEKFWPQFKLWDNDSLITFTWKTHRAKRRRYAAAMADPAWAHINWVRLRSQRELDAWVRRVEREMRAAQRKPLPSGRGSDAGV